MNQVQVYGEFQHDEVITALLFRKNAKPTLAYEILSNKTICCYQPPPHPMHFLAEFGDLEKNRRGCWRE